MRIPFLRLLVAVPFLAAAQFAHAQAIMGPPSPLGPPAPITAKPDCPPPDPNSEEIVVCGERYDEDSPYRIPRELRDRGPVDDRQQSWDARVRDMESVDQYSSQTVGPWGYLQSSRQRNCEWLADRQLAQGRQPDCTRKPRPNEATDWQRR
jgi:hypothetical protein